MSKQAMKLALEALEDSAKQPVGKRTTDAITALREALAEQPAQQCKRPTCQSEEAQQALAEQIKRELVGEQPAQQEPVAEIVSDVNGRLSTQWSDDWTPNPGDKLYTAPQAQPKENT